MKGVWLISKKYHLIWIRRLKGNQVIPHVFDRLCCKRIPPANTLLGLTAQITHTCVPLNGFFYFYVDSAENYEEKVRPNQKLHTATRCKIKVSRSDWVFSCIRWIFIVYETFIYNRAFCRARQWNRSRRVRCYIPPSRGFYKYTLYSWRRKEC